MKRFSLLNCATTSDWSFLKVCHSIHCSGVCILLTFQIIPTSSCGDIPGFDGDPWCSCEETFTWNNSTTTLPKQAGKEGKESVNKKLQNECGFSEFDQRMTELGVFLSICIDTGTSVSLISASHLSNFLNCKCYSLSANLSLRVKRLNSSKIEINQVVDIILNL